MGLSIAGFVVCVCCVGTCATAARGGSQRTCVVTHTTAPSSKPQVNVVNTNSSHMMQVCVCVCVYLDGPQLENRVGRDS